MKQRITRHPVVINFLTELKFEYENFKKRLLLVNVSFFLCLYVSFVRKKFSVIIEKTNISLKFSKKIVIFTNRLNNYCFFNK